MKRPRRTGRYLKYRFSLEQLADLVCEFTQDGKNPRGRDVVDWFRWLERKCRVRESYIFTVQQEKPVKSLWGVRIFTRV